VYFLNFDEISQIPFAGQIGNKVNRKIALMAFIIVCLTFSRQVFASSSHFGIIDAIEDEIDELREEISQGSGEPTIAFSGYNWKLVYADPPLSSGPNYFSVSEENVWVDGEGQLHLKITKRDGKWYCAEVIIEASLGYGKYIFYLASRIDQLDNNVVVALFTWDDTSSEYNNREIDIEFSKWGEAINENAQYVVQPWTKAGNMKRFNIELDSDYSTHIFDWRPDSIFFQSLRGHHSSPPADSYIIESWTYTGSDIPPTGKENVQIMFWLMLGNPPFDGKEAELVIKKFEFVPSDKVEPYE